MAVDANISHAGARIRWFLIPRRRILARPKAVNAVKTASRRVKAMIFRGTTNQRILARYIRVRMHFSYQSEAGYTYTPTLMAERREPPPHIESSRNKVWRVLRWVSKNKKVTLNILVLDGEGGICPIKVIVSPRVGNMGRREVSGKGSRRYNRRFMHRNGVIVLCVKLKRKQMIMIIVDQDG